jgi:hypothetical protein
MRSAHRIAGLLGLFVAFAVCAGGMSLGVDEVLVSS